MYGLQQSWEGVQLRGNGEVDLDVKLYSERMAKLINGQNSLTLFAKWFILDVWQGCEYASVLCTKHYITTTLNVILNQTLARDKT